MSLLYGLNYFVDVLLYFAILGVLGVLWNASERLFFIPMLLFAGCALSHALSGRKKEWLMWLPLFVFIPCLILARGWGERLLCVAPSVYLFFYIRGNSTVADYYYVARKFRGALIGLCFVMFLVMINPAKSWANGLIYLFLYFAMVIFLLRMLRHDDSTAKSLRFRAMNLAGVASVCAAGFALSRPAVVAVIGKLWALLRDQVLARILAVVLYLVEWVLYGINWVLGMLLPNSELEMDFGGMPAMQMDGGMEELLGPAEEGEVQVNPVARAIVIGIGVALLAAVVILVVRLLSRQTARMGTHNDDDERETLTEAEAEPNPGFFRRRRDAEEGVRWYYRRSLQWLKARGGVVSAYMNTEQIQDANADQTDEAALAALREVYLPVRYAEAQATKADAQRAREAYEAIKRGAKSPKKPGQE